MTQLLGASGELVQLFGLTLALRDGGVDSKPFFVNHCMNESSEKVEPFAKKG